MVYWRTSLTANLLLNVPAGGKISRQAPCGRFSTLSTHVKWITGFDAGSQALSLTCAGCCGNIGWFSWLELQPMIAALHHSTLFLLSILSQPYPHFQLSASGLWRQSSTGRLEKGRNLHLRVRNLAFISKLQTVYCMAMRLFVTMVTQEEEGSSLIINEAEMNLTWPTGKQTRSGSALVFLLEAPAFRYALIRIT